MAESQVFDWVCDLLERETLLNRLEARGTVRLAMREAGLAPKSVTVDQIAVVLEKLLPQELEARSIPDGEAICKRLAEEIRGKDFGEATDLDSPEAIFRRLGSG